MSVISAIYTLLQTRPGSMARREYAPVIIARVEKEGRGRYFIILTCTQIRACILLHVRNSECALCPDTARASFANFHSTIETGVGALLRLRDHSRGESPREIESEPSKPHEKELKKKKGDSLLQNRSILF